MAADLFRSERLFYRAIQPPKTGKDGENVPNDPFGYFFQEFSGDPSRVNVSSALWRPPNMDFADYMRRFATTNQLVSVYMCVPVDQTTTTATAAAEQEATGPPESVPVGIDVTGAGASAVPVPASHRGLRPIGLIHLSGPANESPQWAQHRRGTISIALLAAYQGRGYGGEAIRWITDWAFRVAGLHRVEIAAGGWNVGAQRLYERLGFRREGVRRRALWFMGGWRDSVELAMLEEEFWQADWVKSKGWGTSDEEVAKRLGCA